MVSPTTAEFLFSTGSNNCRIICILSREQNVKVCLVFLSKLLLIRPKLILCDDANYRETRWFTAWTKVIYINTKSYLEIFQHLPHSFCCQLYEIEDHILPEFIFKITGQKSVPFGDAVLQTRDTTIGFEICEELWNPSR